MTDCLEILRQHNAWRRGDVEECQNTPTEIGQAIDAAVAECERQAEKLERLQQIVTGKHESKAAFVARVRAVLSGEVANG